MKKDPEIKNLHCPECKEQTVFAGVEPKVYWCIQCGTVYTATSETQGKFSDYNTASKQYAGGKNGAGTYQKIINKIPPHKRYIELFLGSGAILNNKKPALENFGIEKNKSTIDKFDYYPFAFIINECAFEWIERNKNLFTKDTYVYIDPPYPMESRKAQRNIYQNELTQADHIKLLHLVKALPSMVAISTYKNDLYSHELNEWSLYTFDSQTRQGSSLEHLYMNYPEPLQLHDYNFLGKDFTERQRIKRKIIREINKLKGLPLLERQAILEGIRSSIDYNDYAR